MRALAILINPEGEEFFLSYGPATKIRDKATRYLNPSVAISAARSAIFGDPNAFWESERQHAANVCRERKGWTFRVEEVPESDARRSGYSVARYQSGSPARHYRAIGGGFTTNEAQAALWDTRPEAVSIANGINKPEGWLVCVSNY